MGGRHRRANAFARRAVDQLDRGTTNFRRADDILLITDPSNPENRDFYERYGRSQRLSLETNGREMPFGIFAPAPLRRRGLANR